jgi:hypothetical protein
MQLLAAVCSPGAAVWVTAGRRTTDRGFEHRAGDDFLRDLGGLTAWVSGVSDVSDFTTRP